LNTPTMNAFVKVMPEVAGVEYLEMDAPRIKPDQVLIQVKAAGVCGTDVHLYDWADNIVREYKPKLPLIMGHEFAGAIAEVGSEAQRWKVGDRVTAFPVLYCGECFFCRNGQQNICDSRPLLGLGANGCFAEFVAVRSANVYRLDEAIPFDVGALSELACVGMHAIERIRLNGAKNIAVVGCGPLGLMLAILAKHSGAAQLFVTGLESDRVRLEIARQLGATAVQVPASDARELILSRTNGLGADIVFETAGVPAGVLQSMEIVRKGGKVSILGQGHGTTEIHGGIVVSRSRAGGDQSLHGKQLAACLRAAPCGRNGPEANHHPSPPPGGGGGWNPVDEGAESPESHTATLSFGGPWKVAGSRRRP